MNLSHNFNKKVKASFFQGLGTKHKTLVSLKHKVEIFHTQLQNRSIRLSENKNFIRNINLNTAIESSFQTKNPDELFVSPIVDEFVIELNPIFLNVEKELTSFFSEKRRQNHFFIKELTSSVSDSNGFLVRLENSTYSIKDLVLIENLKNNLLVNYKASLYSFKSLRTVFLEALNYFNYNYYNKYNLTLFMRLFTHIVHMSNFGSLPLLKISRFNIFILNTDNFLKWEESYSNRISLISNSRNFKAKQQKISTYLARRSSNFANVELLNRAFLAENNVSITQSSQNYVWKRGFKHSNMRLIGKSLLPLKKDRRYNFAKRHTSFQLIYLLSRIEDKIQYYTEIASHNEVENLNEFRTLLLELLAEKRSRIPQQSSLLTERLEIFKVRRRRWYFRLSRELLLESIRRENVNFTKFVLNLVDKMFNIKTGTSDLVFDKLSDSGEDKKSGKQKRGKMRLFSKEKSNVNSLVNSLDLSTRVLRTLHYFKVANSQPFYKRFLNRKNPEKLKQKVQINYWFKNILRRAKRFKYAYTYRYSRYSRIRRKKKKAIILRRQIRKYSLTKPTLRRNWVESKIIIGGRNLLFKEKKALLSSLLGQPMDLFFINALSFIKFAFKCERLVSPKNSPNRFLSVIDRDFINKYKYIGIYIKDLVRITLISMFFKKPSFLAKYVAFQLAKLPKNRKETSFIRFLIKVIRTLGAERKEISGVRLRFKGRVNRWRRTKFILKTRGWFPLQTIRERIEQGTAQAVNRKGAVGIKIVLRYKLSGGLKFRNHVVQYIKYSRILRKRCLKKCILFNTKR